MHLVGRLLPVLLIARALGAQEPPSCAAILDAFRAKIETNYAGMRLEVTGPRRAEFEETWRVLANEAAGTTGDGCYFILDRLTRWFQDPHLFVFQSARVDSAEAARRAAGLRMLPVDQSRLRAELLSPDTRRDPIEGIWYDGRGLRVAVIPDGAPERFVAVVVTSDTTGWPVGAVRATIRRTDRRRYAVTLFERDFGQKHLDASIHKDVILRLSPGIWAKESAGNVVRGLVDATVPHRPTLVRRGNTVIVSMVSHDPAYRRILDSLVSANDSALRSADKLIVDMRGNEGGAAFTSNALRPFIESRERRQTPNGSDTAFMLSSPDQIAYAGRALASDTTEFVRELVSRLRAAPGELVPMPTSGSTPSSDIQEIGPAKVAVITDGGTVSAAEALVLRALRSTRALVVGQPTKGALDYQSVNIVRALPGENRWFLGYPTITASRHLPRGGMRGKGITPDREVPVEGLWSAIDRTECLMDEGKVTREAAAVPRRRSRAPGER